MKRFLSMISVILTVFMLLPAAHAEEGHTHDGITFTPVDYLPVKSGDYYLTCDVELSEDQKSWTVPEGPVNLCLNGHGIYGSGEDNSPVIIVGKGSIFALYDCGDESHRYILDSDGMAVLDDKNEYAAEHYTFTGGFITKGNGGDNGGGVYVCGGEFDMYGGTIIGNKTTNGGSGVRVDSGFFGLHEGRICYNVGGLAAGIRVYGSDSDACDVRVYGGSIDHNKVISGGSGTHSGCGGGVMIDGGETASFMMSEGVIEANSAVVEGGGIFYAYNEKGTALLFKGNPSIKGNTVGRYNGQVPNNVYLDSVNGSEIGQWISLYGDLDKDVRIPVTTFYDPCEAIPYIVIAPDINMYGYAKAKNFVSDIKGYIVVNDGTDAVLCSENAGVADITVTAEPEGYGTVTGGDLYLSGSHPASVKVNAVPATGCRFVKWTEEEEVSTDSEYVFTASESRDLTAHFEKMKYTITWKQDDGSVIESTSVEYGSVPTHSDPEKKDDDLYTYEFAGWEGEDGKVYKPGDDLPKAEDAATYKATYTATRIYTITFINDDGSVLQSGKVRKGSVPKYNGKDPKKEADAQYTYSFLKWTPEIDEVSADTTYTAVYSGTLNKYKVTFLSDDGTELKTAHFDYGEMPVYGGDGPVKAETEKYTYSFSGWTPKLEKVTGDATYTAVFEAVEKPVYTITEGADSTVTSGSGSSFRITVKRSVDDDSCFSHFKGVSIDGKALDKSAYKAEKGSTVVTLSADTVGSLSVGEHTVTVEFDDGNAEAVLLIEKDIVPPATGDTSGIWIQMTIISFSALGLCVLNMKIRKRRCD